MYLFEAYVCIANELDAELQRESEFLEEEFGISPEDWDYQDRVIPSGYWEAYERLEEPFNSLWEGVPDSIFDAYLELHTWRA
jgi:hypothetical protein